MCGHNTLLFEYNPYTLLLTPYWIKLFQPLIKEEPDRKQPHVAPGDVAMLGPPRNAHSVLQSRKLSTHNFSNAC